MVAALEIKMENERNGIVAGSAPRGAERTASPAPSVTTQRQAPVEDDDDNVVLPTDAEVEAATTPVAVATVVPATSPTLQKAKKAASVADFEAAFKNIFPEKK